MEVRRSVLRYVLLGLTGLLLEVFFTGIARGLRGHVDIVGHTSPWMFIDYCLLGVVLPLSAYLKSKKIPWGVRAFFYMMVIFAIEFATGWIFDQFGIHIWNYSKKPLNLYGYITLMYAPFWYALGLGAEWLNRKMDLMAWALVNASRIEAIRNAEKSATAPDLAG